MDLLQLVDICKGHTIYIQTHNFPDPDAIASAYGLKNLLLHYGINSKICYTGKIDKLSGAKMLSTFNIEMASYDQLYKDMREEDYIICVDSQKNSGNITDFVGNEVACIDHHPLSGNVKYLYSDIRITGACATLITEYYIKNNIVPDTDTATALLYGIKIDTLHFSRGVTPLDIEMFGYLYPIADHQKLSRLERNNLEFTDLRAYGEAIENIELYQEVGFSHISFPCPDALIAILADFILSLEEVEVAVVSSKRDDGIKISVRSETSKVHAGAMLRAALTGYGSGGGHATMAGGLIKTEDIDKLGNFPEGKINSLILEILDGLEEPS